MIDMGAFTRFVSFEVPQRGPDSLDCLNQSLIAANVRYGRVQSGAAEVWQIFGVRRASDKQTLTQIFRRDLFQNLIAQVWIKFTGLYSLPHCRQLLSA